MRLHSYTIRFDTGAAPNPFWGICTLAICKPKIRKKATLGDWIIGFGSKNAEVERLTFKDLSEHIVFAMRVDQILSFNQYDKFCLKNLPNKIPKLKTNDWRRRVGDCLYYDVTGYQSSMREGVHDISEMYHDLKGEKVLLSSNFYYFGASAKLPSDESIQKLKITRGHKSTDDYELVERFFKWISQYDMNHLYDFPQRAWVYNKNGMNVNSDKCD